MRENPAREHREVVPFVVRRDHHAAGKIGRHLREPASAAAHTMRIGSITGIRKRS
jgi:hypothetical protein